jgi:rRNA processing protein Gar1
MSSRFPHRKALTGGFHALGTVENIAYDGSILVRAGFAPPRGAVVVDRRRRPVGRVVKVFGPVKEPFATVRPEGRPGIALIGAEVFIEEVGNARQEDRRGRRGHPVSRVQ